MPALIFPSGLFFGIPSQIPRVPGFTMEAASNRFLTAHREGVAHYVIDRGNAWELWPERNGFDGHFADTANAFFIEKPDAQSPQM